VIDSNSVEFIKQKLNKCMFKMYQEFPFWAFLIEKCKIHVSEKENLGTAAIDADGNIYFDVEFAKSCSDSMMHFVLAHEVMHLLLGHFERLGARDRKIWNIAGDVLINHMLEEHFSNKGIYLDLKNSCTPDKFQIDVPDECTTEEIYDKIMADVKKALKQLGDQPQDMMPDRQKGDNSVCVRPNSENTPASEKEWAEAGLESATRSRMAGSCPAFMERIVEAMNTSKVPWNEVLAYYLRQKFCGSNKTRHTFTPPNRRYLYQDMVLTSRVGGKKPSLAFCIDTSGSMSPEDISTGISELDAIRKMYKVPVYLIECDHHVHNAKWVHPYEEIPKVIGGGGTSFVPVINHLQENDVDIDVLVFFTDGEGDFGNAPDFDTLWVINSKVTAPYGKTIRI
jgi:predicted metal-dependent peptidase